MGYSHKNKGKGCYNKNTKRIIDCIDVKVDEYIESEEKQPTNISLNKLVNNNKEDHQPLSEEDNEEPTSPQAQRSFKVCAKLPPT